MFILEPKRKIQNKIKDLQKKHSQFSEKKKIMLLNYLELRKC